MDDVHWGVLLSRWLHVTAAIVVVGGAAFVRLALLPGAWQTREEETHGAFHEAFRSRWARVTHLCLLLLLVTGSFSFAALAMPSKIDPIPYHPIFGIKIVAAAGVFFIACVLSGRRSGLARMRQASSRWLSTLLVLAALIVALSGLLGQVRAGSVVEGTTQPAHESTQTTQG